MNFHLKEIAASCGITKNVTCHLARHTFATTVTLTNGVPLKTVSQMLGHKNIHTTQLYAKIVDKKIAQDMAALVSVLKNKDCKAVRDSILPSCRQVETCEIVCTSGIPDVSLN